MGVKQTTRELVRERSETTASAPRRHRADSRGAASHAAPDIRAAGNQQIQRMCGPGARRAGGEGVRRLAASGPQPTLRISAPGDAFEHEADRVADQVMRVPDTQVQRSCSCHGAAEAGDLMRSSAADLPAVQTKRTSSPAHGAALPAPPSIGALQGGGRPLDRSSREFFEPRFGRDLGHVRIHADTSAAEMARSMGARAFTYRNHIVLGTGEHESSATDDRRLLAHELVHTVQQRSGPDAGTGVGAVSDGPVVQRLAVLSEAALEIAVANAPRISLLLEQYGGLVEAGAVAAEEVAVVTTAVAEAEVAVAAAAELAAAGTTATVVGETALVATAGLAADDVTGIGVVDDVAIPFTLVAGLVGLGIGAGIAYYYRGDISAALQTAADKVIEVIRLITEVVARRLPTVEAPPTRPEGELVSRPETEPKTSTQPQRRTTTRPDVDLDVDELRRRRGCIYLPVAQQFGQYPCHADYATSISGVRREVRIITPEGDSADFDAMDAGLALYEVKTGYRWVAFTPRAIQTQGVAARFYVQAANQMIVAERCGHELSWYFNDPYAASAFGAENAPYPDYELVPMPVPVWHVPYDCDGDSD